MPEEILGLILGGGRGTRLLPLTEYRSKPAVPFGGKYRLVDIPVSNCMNSGIKRIFVLTQFNSFSLNRHISRTYRFSNFSINFVEILATGQTLKSNQWSQGTADAVRKVMNFIERYNTPYVLILAGDHLYRMDFQKLLEFHKSIPGTHITIPTIPKSREEAYQFGVMKTKEDGEIIEFQEKPKDPKIVDSLLQPDGRILASMGIYLFNTETLIESINNNFIDFGKEVIPHSIDKYKVRAHIFDDYWEDIGTIKAFHKAHMDLLPPNPNFGLYESKNPIYTNSRYLPATQITDSEIYSSLVSDGCILEGCKINNSTIGIRSIINKGTLIEESIIMGNDRFPHELEKKTEVELGIGKNCIIKKAIIDKDVYIGNNVKIENKKNVIEYEDPEGRYVIRDGIIVIPKKVILPDNFEI